MRCILLFSPCVLDFAVLACGGLRDEIKEISCHPAAHVCLLTIWFPSYSGVTYDWLMNEYAFIGDFLANDAVEIINILRPGPQNSWMMVWVAEFVCIKCCKAYDITKFRFCGTHESDHRIKCLASGWSLVIICRKWQTAQAISFPHLPMSDWPDNAVPFLGSMHNGCHVIGG